MKYVFIYLFILSIHFSNAAVVSEDWFTVASMTKEVKYEVEKTTSSAQLDSSLHRIRTLINQGKYRESLDRLTDLKKQIDDISDTQKKYLGRFNNLKGESLRGLGDQKAAIEQFKMAELIFRDTAGDDLAATYNNLGVSYWNNNNLNLSITYHTQALQIYEALYGKSSVQAADSYNNLGLVQAEDDYFNALINYTKAEKIYSQALGEKSQKLLNVKTNIAFLEVNQGNLTKAIESFRDILTQYNEQYKGAHPNKAFILLSIGKVHHDQQSFEKALQYFDESLEMYKVLFGDYHHEVVNAYTLKGNSYMAMKSYRAAITMYQKSIYANLSLDSFKTIYELPSIASFTHPDALLTSLQLKARAFEALHFNKTLKSRDIDAALQTMVLADQLISDIRNRRVNEKDKIALGKISAELYEDGIALCNYMLDLNGSKKNYLKKAFYFFERSKSSVLLSAINDTKAKSFAGIPQATLEEEDSIRKKIEQLEFELRSTDDSESQRLLREQLIKTNSNLNTFVSQLERQFPKYFELKYKVAVSTIEETQTMLKANEAIISYLVPTKREQLYILYISKKRAELVIKERDTKLTRIISGFRNSILYQSNKTSVFGEKLYTALLPSSTIEREVNSLTILPDQILSTIPFEALVSTKKGKSSYLIQDYQISYGNSITLLLDNLKSRDEDHQNRNGAVLIAPVDFPNANVGSLPGSSAETKDIQRLFKTADQPYAIFMNQKANEEDIKALDFSTYDFVHFATHGEVNQSEPSLSRIFLANKNEEDGYLYASEIYNLSINTELVCLSACETGQGKLEVGEGLVGLSRALSYAGAKNLIVSLWAVSDLSTATLMVDFYKNFLLKDYDNFSSALRKAKLQLMNQPGYEAPYYWAPFILIGN